MEGFLMTVSNKNLLIQAIDGLSEDEISIILRMIKGLLNSYEEEYIIEPLPAEEYPRHLKILEEMRGGEYVVL